MSQRRLILAMFVAAFGVERLAQAEVKNWFGGTGTFGVDANWVPPGVPTSADEAMFGGGPYVVSFDKDEPSLRAISSAKATFDLNSFAYEIPDFIEFNTSSETRVEDGTISADRVLIDASATVSVGNGGVLAATSAFNVSSSGVLLIESGGVATSGGDFDFQNGPLLGIDAGGKVVASNGPIELKPAAILFGNGSLETSDELDSTGGIIRPGKGDFSRDAGGTASFVAVADSIGKLSVLGGFVQQQSAAFEAELASATNYDVLHVSSVAKLGGTLRVILKDGFSPALGDAFTVLEANAVEDDFSVLDLPSLGPGLSWVAGSVPVGYQVRVVPEPPAPGLLLAGAFVLGLFALGAWSPCNRCEGNGRKDRQRRGLGRFRSSH